MKNIELLAPAGRMESLYAAINNGANAVYLGGNKFSARAYASNFDNEELKKAVDYCHSYNVKIYVTLNTLLKEKELQEAIKYVGYLYEIGVDALIIQDVGLVKLIREKYSDFEIHASTQITIHNGEGALYFKEKGFTRIVLSRELSLEEIEYISKTLNIETEIFIHGALCISYSGKCLMSSMIGGRSGNRGRCAQPCRMEYTLKSNNGYSKKAYLLSPKDMCTIDNIKDIIKSSAYSLKIEGRMKRPEYVAGVVKNYREALDKEIENTDFNVEEGKETLLQLFNREGFSNGFLKGNIGKDMMSYSFPKNTGIEIGKIMPDGSIIISENIALGDGIRVGNNGGFTLSKILKNEVEVKEAFKGDRVKLFPKEYKKGDTLYRTSSKKLFDTLEDTIKPYYKKIEIEGEVVFKVNEKVKLSVNYNGEHYEVFGDIVEKAEKRPLDKERVIENLQKSGDYPYKISKISFTDFEDGFLRVSSLNNLRRELFEVILKKETSKYRRRRTNVEKSYNTEYKQEDNIDLIYTCATKEQLNVLINENVSSIAVDFFNKSKNSISLKDLEGYSNINFYLRLPEIIKSEFNNVVSVIEKSKDLIKGLITSNVGIIRKYKDSLEIIGDYKLNIYNSEAIKFYREDLRIITLSLELNRKEIKEVLKNNIGGIAYVIYGKTELMVSEYCPIGSTIGGKCKDKNCSSPCLKDEFTLVDKFNEGFRVMTDKYCRSHILNSTALNLIEEMDELKEFGVTNFRVDFTDENAKEVKEVIEMIKNKSVLDRKYTKGHYKRGVE
ncbi:MAG: U32 family peptidase [Clostridiales bacterium]|mgnify:CR=1 FL=1|nr:U32 family peptidase [Clostridiales bacterium]